MLRAPTNKKLRKPNQQLPVICGDLLGTVSSGCFLTSIWNSLVNLVMVSWTMNHFKNHPFTGGDDICAIVEKRDVAAIELEFLKNYTVKGSDVPGRSGLIIDGFK